MFDGHKPGKEMDDTAASAADDRLEEILRRVKAAGAEMKLDERVPLQIEFNNEIVEIGEQRVVEFNWNRTDFQITRKVKNMRVSGGDRNRKHLENVSRPMIETTLKRKPDSTDQWIGVDIEDVF